MIRRSDNSRRKINRLNIGNENLIALLPEIVKKKKMAVFKVELQGRRDDDFHIIDIFDMPNFRISISKGLTDRRVIRRTVLNEKDVEALVSAMNSTLISGHPEMVIYLSVSTGYPEYRIARFIKVDHNILIAIIRPFQAY